MRMALTVVDDFYDDFEAIRATALAAEYEDGVKTPQSGKYPGRNSRRSFGTREALEKLTVIAGSPVAFTPDIGSGHFRSTVAGDERPRNVHIDATQLSAVIYLNTQAQCDGRIGTCFWKHRPTGLLAAPADPVERARLLREQFAPDSNDKDKWELQMQVPLVPNRLILFSASMFHSPHDEFGHDLATGRLIQVYFLTRVRG
ncbi:MAG: DUF6445 family protein [Deltaproteobacteria bacterium]|nr:DUF6445 family protein [Deltaproteobacteria bacterium]